MHFSKTLLLALSAVVAAQQSSSAAQPVRNPLLSRISHTKKQHMLSFHDRKTPPLVTSPRLTRVVLSPASPRRLLPSRLLPLLLPVARPPLGLLRPMTLRRRVVQPTLRPAPRPTLPRRATPRRPSLTRRPSPPAIRPRPRPAPRQAAPLRLPVVPVPLTTLARVV